MTEEQRYDLIEKYLKNQLSGQELSDFESDADLMKDAKLHQAGRSVVGQHYKVSALDSLKEIGAKRRNRIKTQRIIAGISGIVAIAIGISIPFMQESEEKEQADAKPNEILIDETNRKADSLQEIQDYRDSISETIITIREDEIREEPESSVEVSDSVEVKKEVTEVIADTATEDVSVQEDPIEEVTVVEENTEPENTCDQPELKIKTLEANLGEENGTLIVNGDKKDIDKLKFMVPELEDDYTFLGTRFLLAPGKYTVLAKEGACEFNYGVWEVEQSAWPKKLTYAFNPDYEEAWKLPLLKGEAGSFDVLNKAGMLIYSEEFDGTEEVSWDGKDEYGKLSGLGLHAIIIKYKNTKGCMLHVVLEQ